MCYSFINFEFKVKIFHYFFAVNLRSPDFRLLCVLFRTFKRDVHVTRCLFPQIYKFSKSNYDRVVSNTTPWVHFVTGTLLEYCQFSGTTMIIILEAFARSSWNRQKRCLGKVHLYIFKELPCTRIIL